jgi:hypothetical protein
MHQRTRLLCGLPALLLILPQSRPSGDAARISAEAQAHKVAYVGGGLSYEQLLVLSTAVAARRNDSVMLLDSPALRPHVQSFLAAFQPGQVVPVGTFKDCPSELRRQLGERIRPIQAWAGGPPAGLWESLFPQAACVIVCPPAPRGQLLQAGCLAGVLGMPLFVMSSKEDAAELQQWVHRWKSRELLVVGNAAALCRQIAGVEVTVIPDAEAVADAHRRRLAEQGPIETIVVANPADRQGKPATSVLAPWIALQRRAALLLTNERGDNATAAIHKALLRPELAQADALILVGDLEEIPTERRPNPIFGKDTEIEMEPMTPEGSDAFTLATGRLFHQDLAVVPLQLARQKLLEKSQRPPRALIVSNPGGGLPLLETFSRQTVREFRNNGYQATALFDDATPEAVRELVTQSNIFLWEGHHKTLIEEFGMPDWREPLPSSLVFLQSCLALNEEQTQGLFQRGAVVLVGSATRTYSATGGAFTLAFFDAMLYDRQTVGGSLRQAKNFLLCYTLLKEKRLGSRARLTGANVRSSWAFTLWGDPTLRLPAADAPADGSVGVQCQARANTITLKIPARAYEKVQVDRFTAEMRPNARLAGLLTVEGEDNRRLVPFVFAEAPLPMAPPGRSPRLTSRLPERNYVWVWDARRRCLYVLAMPRARDTETIRFRLDWQ